MTVKEYREKHPNCGYCVHKTYGSYLTCDATLKRMSKGTAKKCPCYVPAEWRYEKGGKRYGN